MSPLVPLIDRLLPGGRYVWLPHRGPAAPGHLITAKGNSP